MPGSEDLLEEGKPARGKGEEPLLVRESQDDSQTNRVARGNGEGKYFAGASSFMDPPDTAFHEATFKPKEEEEIEAVYLEAAETLDTLVPSTDQVKFGTGEPTADLAIHIELDPTPEKLDLNQLVETARNQLQNGDYAACLKTVHTGLREDPGNYQLSTLQTEAQRGYELRRAEEELSNQIASVKTEAIELFRSGQFDSCLEKFKFLCKLEPDNREFREFLKASEEQFSKLEPGNAETSAMAQSPAAPLPDKAAPMPPQRANKKSTIEPDAQREPKRADVDSAGTEPDSKPKLKGWALAGMIVAALLLGAAAVGGWLSMRPRQSPIIPEFQAEPDGGSAFLNREPNAGPERLKIPLSDLQSSATTLFDQGKFLEASRKCEAILSEDPENRFALGLKQDIIARLVRLATQTTSRARWEEARTAWNNVLKVDPNDSEAINQLKVVRTKVKKQEELATANKVDLQRRIQDLHQQITLAMGSKNYLPPGSGNAFELIKELSGLSPSDSLVGEKLDHIYLETLTQAHRRIQAHDLVGATALVQQIQTYFPQSLELKGLRETLKLEETKLLEARSILTQKAELAMVAGHYITPPNDNSVAYCNQVLMADPQNQKALSLKKESLMKATAQAQEWTQKGKFEEASGVYSSLLYLSQNDSRFPFSGQDLKREVDKLEFTASPVVHHHTIGSCSGRLRFNGYQIAFVPSGDSRDGFSQTLKEITQIEGGDKLKIQFKDKTYRFEISTAKSKEENREKISRMLERLALLTSKKQ
jgi:tetratricopeptide (TPR) repeat protein